MNEIYRKAGEYMSDDNFSQQAGMDPAREIRLMQKAIRRTVDEILTQEGLDKINPMFPRIVRFLMNNRDRDIFQKDIESEFGIARSTVTGLLKQMEQQNMICRCSVDSDARLKKVMLTEETVQKVEEGFVNINRILDERMLRGISEEEHKIFCSVIGRMRNNLETISEEERRGKA